MDNLTRWGERPALAIERWYCGVKCIRQGDGVKKLYALDLHTAVNFANAEDASSFYKSRPEILVHVSERRSKLITYFLSGEKNSLRG